MTYIRCRRLRYHIMCGWLTFLLSNKLRWVLICMYIMVWKYQKKFKYCDDFHAVCGLRLLWASSSYITSVRNVRLCMRRVVVTIYLQRKLNGQPVRLADQYTKPELCIHHLQWRSLLLPHVLFLFVDNGFALSQLVLNTLQHIEVTSFEEFFA